MDSREQMSDGERLACMTVQIYEEMMGLCTHIHEAFSDMLTIAEQVQSDSDRDWNETDEELKEWMEQQVKNLEILFKANDLRADFVDDLLKRSQDPKLSVVLGGNPPSGTVH